MEAAASQLKVGRTQGGYCVRVEGRGTMRESPAVFEFGRRTMEGDPTTVVVVDLTGCDYLDSTFLGCLLGLHKRFGKTTGADAGMTGGTPGPRFSVAAEPQRRRKLLGPTRLDLLLKAIDAPPTTIGPWVELQAFDTEAKELGRHVLECHRQLAEVDGPNQAAFRRIVDQMARDVGTESPAE